MTEWEMSEYNLAMVFERTGPWSFGKISITPRMLRLLAAIDGKNTIAEIVEILRAHYENVFDDLQRLHELHLIHMVHMKEATKVVKHEYREVTYRGAKIMVEKTVA